MDAALAFAVTVILTGVVLLWRNNVVYDYRMNMIDEIYNAAYADIRRGLFENDWRWDTFERVSYIRMVFMFWRPCDSFYPDRSFIAPREVG